MATKSHLGLEAFLGELGLGPIPAFPEADILNDPVDIYHAYVAEHLETLVKCDQDIVYSAIQPPHSTVDGDLDVVIPRLKLPGGNPKEQALELMRKAGLH